MGEAKRRKKLDPNWGKPKLKSQMSMDDYKEWAFNELGADAILSFAYFDWQTTEEIPDWVKQEAPSWIENLSHKIAYNFLVAIWFDLLNENFIRQKASLLTQNYDKSLEDIYFNLLRSLIIASGEYDFDEDEGGFTEEQLSQALDKYDNGHRQHMKALLEFGSSKSKSDDYNVEKLG